MNDRQKALAVTVGVAYTLGVVSGWCLHKFARKVRVPKSASLFDIRQRSG